jgi:cell shape-determining protein MreD
MMRFVPYLLYLFLIAFDRTILADLIAIGPAQVYIAALLVLLVAQHKSYTLALWFGVAAGVVFGAADPSRMGIQMLVLAFLGAIMALLKVRFNLDSLRSRFLLIVGGLVLYAVPHTLFSTTAGAESFGYALLRVALPSIAYSAAVAWLLFMIQTGRFSSARMKALFQS